MQRGSDKNSPELDDQMKHEADAMLKGQPQAPHVEEFRETEGFPDDTDSEEVRGAVDDGLNAASEDER